MRDRRRRGGAVNTFLLFKADNPYGIPTMPKPKLTQIPQWLAPFRTRISPQAKPIDGALHFFLEDFRFESVWNKPFNSLQVIQKYKATLSPDFSLYRDWPLAIQIWNTYRSRWMGCFWQYYGYTVIPTISWSMPESYPFAFAGVAIGSVVAISVCGVNHVNNPLEHAIFLNGFREMVKVIRPTAVLCYGTPPFACANYADVWVYPTEWTNIRAMRKKGADKLNKSLAPNPIIEQQLNEPANPQINYSAKPQFLRKGLANGW